MKKFKTIQFLKKGGLLLLVFIMLTQTIACASTSPKMHVESLQKTAPFQTAPSGITSPTNLLPLSLWASNSPTKPTDPATGYPEAHSIFVDWNLSNLNRWLQWNLPVGSVSQVLWQVSMFPYNNNSNAPLSPPGLVASGLLNSNQTEFNINFGKFAPSPRMVKANFVNSDFGSVVQQNIKNITLSSGAPVSAELSDRILANFNTALKNQTTAEVNQNTLKLKTLVNGLTSITSTSTLPQKTSNPSRAVTNGLVVSDAYMSAQKSILEYMSTITNYTYYVRVLILDAKGQPVGPPSNSIEVSYGDPVFDNTNMISNDNVEAHVHSTGDFQNATIEFLDWTSSAAALNQQFLVPLTEIVNTTDTHDWNYSYITAQDYEYSYFQVTTEPSDFNNSNAATTLAPDGLVANIFSDQITVDNQTTLALANIDFTKFAPPANPNNPVLIKYYVRAVSLYTDSKNPGYVLPVFSSPAIVNYGDSKDEANNEAANAPWVNVNIGAPTISFTKFTPEQSENQYNVIATANIYLSSIHQQIEIGQHLNLWALEAQIDNQQSANDENIFNAMFDAFGGLFSEVENIWDGVGNAWNDVQAYVAQNILGPVLGPLGIPPEVGGFLINAALMAAGIPPTLPNFDQLCQGNIDDITGQIAGELIDSAGGPGGMISSELANQAAGYIVNQAIQEANTIYAPLNNLPDELSDLNGYVKPDPDSAPRPATISLTLANPYNNQIPSGSFRLSIAGNNGNYNFYTPQVVNYPPIKAGQQITLTITLQDYYTSTNTQYQYPNGRPDVPDISQAIVEATNITPNIPDPANFAQQLGLGNIVFIKFNIVKGLPYVKETIKNINAPSEPAYTGEIYVSPSGNDNSNGSQNNPLKTLGKAVSIAGPGNAIFVNPGTYPVSTLNIDIPSLSILAAGPGVVIKTSNDYALQINQSAGEFILKGMEIDGGVYVNGAEGVKLDSLKVNNTNSTGIKLVGGNVNVISNSEIENTGTKDKSQQSPGIEVDNSEAFYIYNCILHDIAGDGIYISGNNSDTIQGFGNIEGVTISQSRFGIYMEDEYHNQVVNTFIHDTRWGGVDFSNCVDCGIDQSTLYNTALDHDYGGVPVSFDVNAKGSNRVLKMESEPGGSTWPSSFWVQRSIIEEQNNILMTVSTSINPKLSGLADDQAPYTADNIYYSPAGPVKLIDQRTGKSYQFNSGGWEGEYSLGDNGNSTELDPKIDARGHNTLPDYQEIGNQWP